ncbi:hypothetical protein AXF42_Ash006729 [Apostasia shenzhenica]|uniref:Uncharacterized protein n=1 Tax=Apostasia shenzhenica TaxID=1088818 RepID=A0A2I0AIZ6_9ASPA|nr:hypothetical protein AXF42_Ash006729 [Apostasia shenzhenica]
MASVSTPRVRVLLAIFLLCATRGEAMDLIPTHGAWQPVTLRALQWEAAHMAANLLNHHGPHDLLFLATDVISASMQWFYDGSRAYEVTVAGVTIIVTAAHIGSPRMCHVTAQIRFSLFAGQLLQSVQPNAIPYSNFWLMHYQARPLDNQDLGHHH